MKNILIIEGEEAVLKILRYNLIQEGYNVHSSKNGQEGLEMALSRSYDMVLLSSMLPNKEGILICRELRQIKKNLPIIMMTTKDTENDKILGLEYGADDCVTKPFSAREMLARMKAIFRRYDQMSNGEYGQLKEKIIIVGDLQIYPEQYKVMINKKIVDLTPKEFDLLLYLARRMGRIISREQLLNAIWAYDFAGETRIVDVHIGNLREKIEENKNDPQYLITARGFGYKLEEPL